MQPQADEEESLLRRRRPSLLTRTQSLTLPEILNPFVHTLELTRKQKLIFAIMSVTVAPIRLLLIIIILLIAWFFSMLSSIRSARDNFDKPLTSWQKFLRSILLFTGRAGYFVAGFHYIEVRGKPAKPSEAAILVAAPHSTFMDAIVFFMPPYCSPISRAENANILFLGRLSGYTNPILVQREDVNSRSATMKKIKKRAHYNPYNPLPSILLFPEGTCSNRRCLITFKPGAFIPGEPVQPLILRWPNEIDTFIWTWQGPGAFLVAWLTLCQFNNNIILEYLPVYYPSEEEKKDPKLYADNVRRVMADCLEVPMTDHSFEDCRLMMMAQKHRLPMATGIVEFTKISRKLALDFNQITEQFRHFSNISGSIPGRINVEDFAQYLGLPMTDAVVHMFDMYDRDNSGTIDFREYLIGLALIANPSKTEETIGMAFEIFDTDKKGYLEVDDFYKVLNAAFNMGREECGKLFDSADMEGSGQLTFVQFANYCHNRPEYAHLFKLYQQFKQDTNPSAPVEETRPNAETMETPDANF